MMMNYAQAVERLGTRDSRKIGNNTYLRKREGGSIAIRLHATDILVFMPDGSVKYDSGGWKTPVTKDRMNEWGPLRISQANGVWAAWDGTRDGESYVYADGMIVKADGKVKGAAKDDEKILAERKRIKLFAKRFMDALEKGKVPAPSGGDCWGCCMRGTDSKGKTVHMLEGGGADDNGHHIREHIRESYFVPSLLANALREMGASQSMYWWVGGWWAETEAEKRRDGAWEERAKEERAKLVEQAKSWNERERVEKALRRYIYRKLGHVR